MRNFLIKNAQYFLGALAGLGGSLIGQGHWVGGTIFVLASIVLYVHCDTRRD